MTAAVCSGSSRQRRLLAVRCRRLTQRPVFTVVAFAMIVCNAVLLGLETYEGIAGRWHGELKLVEHLFLAGFTVEILLRTAAHADRPRALLRDPWNLFDLAVVLLAFLPFARENATMLRLLRLARVLRTARFLPQLRVVVVALGKSLPGTLSFLLVGALLLYLYAMVGWVFFAREDPGHFGSVGRAMLTLFLLMTLDGLGEAVRTGLEISRWSIFYYASYVVLSSFVLVNLLIGVVINSLEEAREAEKKVGKVPGKPPPLPARDAVVAPALDAVTAADDDTRQGELKRKIETARLALDDLERTLTAPLTAPLPPARRPAPSPPGDRPSAAGP
ncbi:ion transporter [Streptomyces iconiensis]|uniref:Ion transporter n=1 Tax=Streptomyces iconiensis TaxID=1384038 RepID=A0ABT7A3X6_9ACTN|nr:ion transporter [Streptomyces iconiensis]MDJ1136052.1 ion transporter [Streptomyces iconiensis]